MTPAERLRSSIEADRAARRAERGRDEVTPIDKPVRESKGLRTGGLRQSKPSRSKIPPATIRALEVRSQGRCEVCEKIRHADRSWDSCLGLADDPHHRRRQGHGQARGGGHQIENLYAVCRFGHAWIHDPRNEVLARRLGLLVLPGDHDFDELGEMTS